MLELRPCCEHCGTDLPPDSSDAMICSFECTFCAACVTDILHNVCPNCGGNFVHRPIRPRDALARHPASASRVFKSVDLEQFAAIREQFQHVPPEQR
ncbi:MAG: DUF1272 domain-containing protein [Saprospiraceae bacterium]|nr:DUF1272 domain-containing protein [Saprospiraceae bacterium]